MSSQARFLARCALVAFLPLASPWVARSATLEVGPDQSYKQPSDAAAAAKDGDTIEIAKGEYFDCAVWRANNLTIEGKEDGVVITDKVCMGKGLFVTSGNDIKIRNLTLTRARVPDQNGAGIRAEGANLTIDRVKFINNQNGILSTDNPASSIKITNSEFTDNGICAQSCSHGIYAGHIAALDVRNSHFLQTKQGHHVKSRALSTTLIDDVIEDGPKGTSSYLVELPNGGSLVMENDQLEKGPNTQNHGTAISIGAEGVTQPTRQLVFKNVKFTNDYPGQTTFVRNLTATEAMITGCSFTGKIEPLEGDGVVH